jgi:phenylacetate-CoA ligase
MEINAETLFVEILDDKGAVLPYGKRPHCNFLYSTKPIRLFVMILAILALDEKKHTKTHFAAINNEQMILLFYPVVKAPGLTFLLHYKSIIEDDGNVKEFTIRQIKTDTLKSCK